MKSFSIGELLFYNPTLKSTKKKPIEIDMQEAKIIAFYPPEMALQQRCNSVGMAEGVYSFCGALLGEEKSSQNSQNQQLQFPSENRPKNLQIIVMDVCCLVLKEVEQNIWLFLKLDYQEQPSYKRLGDKEEQSLLSNTLTETICESIIDHIYHSFRTFYGRVAAFLFKGELNQLQQIITYFVPKYMEIFKYQQNLDIISYIINDIRAIPLDINSTLKFHYFKNVIQSYDSNIMDLIVFANGYLAYSSLQKENTEYFANYLFATGEPYKFQDSKLKNRFKYLSQMPKSLNHQKFGVLYNSRVLGFDENAPSIDRSSLPIRGMSIRESALPGQTDLLGVDEKGRNELFNVHLTKNGEEVVYKINFYMEKSMVFVTFYGQKYSFSQLIFQNRFYRDNADKFTAKISQSLTTYVNRNDAYKFLFNNRSTFTGKSTLREWNILGPQVMHALSITLNCTQGVVATTFQNYWVYSVRRLSRLLLILIPSELPLHKLEDYVNKMTKQYFVKAYI